ncbi:hypothetical protein Tco_0904487, partial [Tanacetum coccineum]
MVTASDILVFMRTTNVATITAARAIVLLPTMVGFPQIWVWKMVVRGTKIVGDLAVGSLKDVNLALLQKWRWRLVHNPYALWVQLIKAVHGPDAGFDQN